MKPRIRWLLFVMAVLAAACGTASPSSGIATVAPDPATAAVLLTPTPSPTVVPTTVVTATPNIPFPITWTVRQATAPDGRTIYIEDDPSVVRSAQEGYERLRVYYTFPNGLPSREQIGQDLTKMIVDPDRVRGAAEQIESIRKAGGYWILPPLSAYQWTTKAEFNQDGSQASLTLTAQEYHAEFFNLAEGQVTFTEDDQGFSTDVTMVYDEFSGLWKLLTEKSAFKQRGRVATVLPPP